MATTAYPLKWPKEWKRENGREVSKFSTTLQKAHKLLSLEIQRMGGEGIVITTDIPLRVDGGLRLDRLPVDSGVAVYFTRGGKQMVIPCDRWDEVKDNLLAVAKTIEAMRGIERWGASAMMERSFAGFSMVQSSAPEPEPEEDWWKVLGVSRDSEMDVVEAVYRTRAKKAHPDNGGSTAAMHRLTRARESARRENQKNKQSGTEGNL